MTVLNLLYLFTVLFMTCFGLCLDIIIETIHLQHRKLLLHLHLYHTHVINETFHTFLWLKVTTGSVYAKHLTLRPMIKFYML